MQALLTKFPNLTKQELGKAKTEAHLEINPDIKPVFCKARPVPLALRPLVEKELDRQIEAGILKPCKSSQWAAPLVTIMKPDGKSVRLCGSYNLTVNRASQLEQYPLPKVDELLTQLSGGKNFSVIDLEQAYLQIPLAEASQQYTAVNTHKGLFTATRLVYGISSGPAIFQRHIETLLAGIPNTTVFLDDICVTGPTDAAHLANLEEVLKRLAQENLRINPKKCRWFLPEVSYLGVRINKEGLHPTDQKVAAVRDAPTPENVSQLRTYLGMLNHFSRFCQKLSGVAAPLFALLRKDVKWRWGAQEEAAFTSTKTLLCQAPCLAHFDGSAPVIVSADASSYGLGAVLSQVTPDGERPVAFASRTLNQAEKNYSQIDREGLALVFAVKRFHSFLYGRPFTLRTDHKPLLGLLGKTKNLPDAVPPRMVRWKVTLDAYQYHLVHTPGNAGQHAAADALSRLPMSETVAESAVTPLMEVVNMLEADGALVTVDAVREWTRRDPVLSEVLHYTRYGWPRSAAVSSALLPYHTRQTELSILNECLLWGCRVVVPPPCRQKALRLLHEGHPGICSMKRRARSQIWWPGMDADIAELTKVCDACQLHQTAAPKVPSRPWQYPDAPWQRVHIDYAGPVDGKMLLIVIDAHSKWPDVWITNNVSTRTTIDHLRMTFATHGLPEVIVSDNGGCFTSKEFNEFTSSNGIRHVFTPPLHPASNGQAENMVKLVKNGIRKQRPAPLLTKLQRWLFQYRNTPHTTTGKSPAEMLFRRAPRTHLTLLHPSEERQRQRCSSAGAGAASRCFRTGDAVYITEVTDSAYKWLPGTVLDVCGPSCRVLLQDGRQFRRHLDHIRARYTSGESELHGYGTLLDLPPPSLLAAPQSAVTPTAVVSRPQDEASPAAVAEPTPPAVAVPSAPDALPEIALPEPSTDGAPTTDAQDPVLPPADTPRTRPVRNRRKPDKLNL